MKGALPEVDETNPLRATISTSRSIAAVTGRTAV